MGTFKLLSDKAVCHHPFIDEGVLSIDRQRTYLKSSEQRQLLAQVAIYYQKKYRLQVPVDEPHMKNLWEGPRKVRRLFFLAAMRASGFRKCAL